MNESLTTPMEEDLRWTWREKEREGEEDVEENLSFFIGKPNLMQ